MNHKNNLPQLLLLLALLSWQALPAQVLVNLAWEQGNGAPSSSIDYTVSALDANGNLIVAGNTITSGEAENFLITKFDLEGQILWEEQYDYSDLTDFAAVMAVDASGNILVAGASATTNQGFDYDLRTFTTDFFGTTAKMPDLADALMWSLTAGPNNSPLFPLAHHGYGFLLNDIQVTQPNVDLFREVWQTVFRAEVTSVVSRGNAIQAAPNAASSIPATFTIDSIQEPSFYFDDWNLSVGASDEGGNLAEWQKLGNPDPFSSFFIKSVDHIAPGVSTFLETTNEQGGYSDFNGTSAAAPHVTGAAALLMSYSDVPLAPEDVEHLLQYGAVPKHNPDTAGWGLLDTYASLKLIEQPEYRVIHFDTVLTGGTFPAAPGTITIRLTADYDTIAAGIYQAIPYQYVANFSYNLGTGVSLAALPPGKPPYWVRATVPPGFGGPMASWLEAAANM